MNSVETLHTVLGSARASCAVVGVLADHLGTVDPVILVWLSDASISAGEAPVDTRGAGVLPMNG